MKMTEQQMTEDLVMRGLEVVRLSSLVSARGLAHAFAEWRGHTIEFTAEIKPADTEYREGVIPTILATLKLPVDFYDFWDEEDRAEAYQQRIGQANDYIRQLQTILDCRQPVLQGVAA